MTDVLFVVTAWGVVLGGTAAYAALLVRRLRTVRELSLRIRRQAEAAPLPPDDRREA